MHSLIARIGPPPAFPSPVHWHRPRPSQHRELGTVQHLRGHPRQSFSAPTRTSGDLSADHHCWAYRRVRIAFTPNTGRTVCSRSTNDSISGRLCLGQPLHLRRNLIIERHLLGLPSPTLIRWASRYPQWPSLNESSFDVTSTARFQKFCLSCWLNRAAKFSVFLM